MSQLPVILAAIIGLVFCIVRRKRYHLTQLQMYFLLFVFTMTGALGSNIGSAVAGGALAGRRLYGLMLSDTAALIIGCKLFKADIGRIGDFISVPILSSCCGGKLNCLLDGCCYGFEMYINSSGEVVRFPSQIFELAMWSGLFLWLMLLEAHDKAENTMWSIAMIWFGLTRYLADFLRGSPSEKVPLVFSIPGGQFWSLILVGCGLAFMLYSLRRKLGRWPGGTEYLKALVGMS